MSQVAGMRIAASFDHSGSSIVFNLFQHNLFQHGPLGFGTKESISNHLPYSILLECECCMVGCDVVGIGLHHKSLLQPSTQPLKSQTYINII